MDNTRGVVDHRNLPCGVRSEESSKSIDPWALPPLLYHTHIEKQKT